MLCCSPELLSQVRHLNILALTSARPATINRQQETNTAKWLKDPHSQAMKSLSNQASLDYAKKNGIADPTKEPSCLACHSTYDQVDPKLRATILQSEGVSCESCHGPGSSYKSPAVMKNVAQAKTMGLVIPDRKLCLKCHNDKNPFHKEFVYETYFAKVNHPNPAKAK